MQEEANSFALELAVHKKCSQTQTCHMNFTFKISNYTNHWFFQILRHRGVTVRLRQIQRRSTELHQQQQTINKNTAKCI